MNILFDGENCIIWFGDMCIVESLLEIHAFIDMSSLYEECNQRCTLHCFGEGRNWMCTFKLVLNLGKIISESKTWYYMHVEAPRALLALEIGETCHT